MMKKSMRRIGLIILVFVLAGSTAATGARDSVRPTRLEKKADRKFIGGYYDRSMEINRRAEQKMQEGSPERLRLELKMARLYTLIQQYEKAIHYYGLVREAADTLLTVEDVCMYIDNMRLVGDPQQAEIVARTYAFRSPYNRNQRYMNMLMALSNKQHYYGRGDSDYKVKRYDRSSSRPDYWIGNYGDQLLYAVSESALQDPLKIYYHRTHYLPYDGEERADSPLKSIPRELHCGPLAFSPDNTIMVATGIDYSVNDRIKGIDQIRGLYPTQLYYSIIEDRTGRWSAFRPLFEYLPGYSYAHPSFFNEGRSILFSSDVPGGFGGMDLYVCHWNESRKGWSDPVNLGPYVNTEGDEVYPFVDGNRLYFSSNGLEGFGGYDIYHIIFGGNLSTIGSLFHYPYPVNTASNDFGAYIDRNHVGYFVSDRRGPSSKDDIYTFDSSVNSLGSDLSIGVSQEFSAMTGNLNLINGLGSSNNTTLEKELIIPDDRPEEPILTIYFRFDRAVIDRAGEEKLDSLLADYGSNLYEELLVVGYADEHGGKPYNQRLSLKRAQAVARYLTRRGFEPALDVEGCGQLILEPEEYTEQMELNAVNLESRSFLSMSDRIRITSKARRVDIYIKK
jgi:outer membrane protein OmpA-like peptidoglycan-associated protein